MGIKVLFIYPNTYGMYMIPPAVALLSAILKKNGHKSEIFDLTFYAADYGMDSDGSQAEKLNVQPFDMASKGIRLKNSDWKVDIAKQVKRFQPDLIAISSTEDMWELGLKVLEEIKEVKIKNNIPVIAMGMSWDHFSAKYKLIRTVDKFRANYNKLLWGLYALLLGIVLKEKILEWFL